jgi:hypothetical protein
MLVLVENLQKQDRMKQDVQLLLAQSKSLSIRPLTNTASRHTRFAQVSRVQSSCTCRVVRNARRWQPTSVIRFTQTFRVQHLSHCAAYESSEQTLEVSMQIFPPSWLLAQTIDVGVQVRNWYSSKPSSICPIVIGTTRLVDPSVSPAFRAIYEAEEDLLSYTPSHACIAGLQRTLQDLFDQRRASALDTDRHGRTLLNVSNTREVLRHYYGLKRAHTRQGGSPTVSRDNAHEISRSW